MYHKPPSFVLAFHGTDREVALKVLNGESDLSRSENEHDWLGYGTYFWEHNPIRAYQYAEDVATGKQPSNAKIKDPFVIGTIIDLGNCLNLVEHKSLQILSEGYAELEKIYKKAGKRIPPNRGGNRKRDCLVFESIHKFNKLQRRTAYDTVRCAFTEGDSIFPGTEISEKHHIQICVRDPKSILGYFLPRPVTDYNPDFKSPYSL